MFKAIKDFIGITARDEEIKALRKQVKEKNLYETLEDCKKYSSLANTGTFSKIVGVDLYNIMAKFYEDNRESFSYLRNISELEEIKKKHEIYCTSIKREISIYDWLFVGCYNEKQNKDKRKELAKNKEGQ